MVGPQRRLDALTSELTARERAILVLRAWCAGEDPDPRLKRYCPPHDVAEMNRLCGAVEHANGQAHANLAILLEWTANLETEIHWHRVLTAYQAREAALEKVARRSAAPLPPPWDMDRKVPLGWGRFVHDEDEGPAEDWPEVRRRCLAGIRRSLAFRWRDVLALEAVFDDIAEALGPGMVHQDVARLLTGLREHVLRLHQVMRSSGDDFELPVEAGDHGSGLREDIDWEAIRGAPAEKHAREWMHEKQLAELEQWEEEQAESLRGRS